MPWYLVESTDRLKQQLWERCALPHSSQDSINHEANGILSIHKCSWSDLCSACQYTRQQAWSSSWQQHSSQEISGGSCYCYDPPKSTPTVHALVVSPPLSYIAVSILLIICLLIQACTTRKGSGEGISHNMRSCTTYYDCFFVGVFQIVS